MSAKKASAVKVDTKQIEEAVAVGKETVEKAVAATKEKVEQAVAATKEQVEKVSEAAVKSYDEVTELNKKNMEVFTTFGETYAKGAEEFGKAYYAFVKTTADANAEAAKAMMSATTVNEFVEIQSDYARTSFDAFVAESGKLNELGVKVATDAFEPVQAHLNDTVERFSKIAA